MSKKNEVKDNGQQEKEKVQKLDLDELDQVSGGSLRNAKKVKTQDISQDTMNKI